MSQVSAVYDAMTARLAALFPQAQRIPYPHLVEANTEVILRDGYGVAMGDGSNTERFSDGELSIQRQFRVVLTKEMISLEGDPEGYAATEKSLLEAALTTIQDFQKDSGLNGEITNNTRWVSDTGANLIASVEGSGIFLSTEIVFQTEYFEQPEE